MSAQTTAEMCGAAHELVRAPLAPEVQRAAERSLLNVLGTAIGASRQPAVDVLLAKAGVHGGAGVAPVPGRAQRTDLPHAALVTGTAVHLDDFDDTHLQTVIHPGGTAMSATLGLAAHRGTAGARYLAAFAVGIEMQLRVGLAMSPSHYDAGWHITGTCGVLGAALGAGLVLELEPPALANALGIAASSTLGVREGFGTMTKPFHVGKAAVNGIHAAMLAARGFTGPPDVLDHPRGLYHVLAERYDPGIAVADVGRRWELLDNTFKPYPCGIVSHPAIDAAVELATRLPDGRAADISEVVITCHPLVVELTGNPEPRDGLRARFSTIHGVAAGLMRGRVGLLEFSDAFVRDAAVSDLRGRCRFVVDRRLARDAAAVEVVLDGAERVSASVQHARGSLARPLTDEQLGDKVRALVEPVLPSRTGDLIASVRGLAQAGSVRELVAATLPETATAGAAR